LALAAFVALPASASEQQRAPDPVVVETLASLPVYHAQEQVDGTIVIWGHGSPAHDFMGALMPRLFREFSALQPKVRFDNRMYGTASAIGALASGAGTLALLGEEISPAAKAMFMRAKGYEPLGIEVANGSVDVNYFDYAHLIYVHRSNPLAHLTAAQLEGIFGSEHRCGSKHSIRKWGALGLTGEWRNRPIQPYSWKTDVDFALFFRERILCGSHRWNPAVREFMPITQADGTVVQHGTQILDALARDPGGIAISAIRFANPEVRPLALAWNTKSPFVQPTVPDLIARRYPLGRIIPAFVDRKPGTPLRPAEREFLRFVLSRQGQTAIAEATGYLPLDAKTAARETEKLK